MHYAEMVDQVAPCGLDCGRCLDNPDSAICGLSQRLREELGGFSALAERFAKMDPAFGEYPAFERLLDRLGKGGCTGCRSGNCLLSGCGVKDCVREQGVDFCHECGDFPCNKTMLPPALHERWKQNNERMREMGLEVYLAEARLKPRY
ncbi:DUF3795 domain-containing protein [Desulfovibrio ferrophilus]|uniref:DUF3795 domain-containing protein n=1 Tax=Desulfovibrio ferrophilus TaxID=241368 RepID=A0A2Z6B0B0_9BACT|nr:DUF3795 domain-containing protein [Desulfovibrio ferrophilus]BBD08967.1 uncharacterized protein DFE_2241 [Desulfovibrio ferrophilus]